MAQALAVRVARAVVVRSRRLLLPLAVRALGVVEAHVRQPVAPLVVVAVVTTSAVGVGSLTGEALQLLSYFKPGTVPRHMVESSAPSSPALDLAVGLIS